MLGDERHESESHGFPDAITILAAGVSVILGLALGSSGPLIVVAVGGFGLLAGPTWGGVVLLLAIGVAAVSGTAGFVAFVIGRGSRSIGAVFIVSVALAIGIIGGAVLGNARHLGGWAPRPTPSQTPARSFAPAPVIYRANGQVTLSLEGVPGFATPTQEPFGDGIFGHWCSSDPGSTVASTIEAEVGDLADDTVRAELQLTDPGDRLPDVRYGCSLPRHP